MLVVGAGIMGVLMIKVIPNITSMFTQEGKTLPINTRMLIATSAFFGTYWLWIIIALVVLHVGAIAFYWLRRRQNLVAPMLHGDKLLTADVPAAIDSTGSRMIALAIAAACAIGVAFVASLDA